MEIIDNLKQDAEAILNYMASNGLVANAQKTIFMILNLTKRECELGITKSMQVGGEIVPRSTNTKLLGVNIDDKQNWQEHFSALQSDLNKRTFQIRRLSNQIPQKEVLKVVQCIWMSRLRYDYNFVTKSGQKRMIPRTNR